MGIQMAGLKLTGWLFVTRLAAAGKPPTAWIMDSTITLKEN
jgi:hypothetical protein